MELDGFDKLLAKFERMSDDIEDDVDTIVKNNTIEMTEKTLKYEVQRFTKGYWTGFTARHTKTEKVNKMHYRTNVNSDYAGFLNFGTRFMPATWFMRDAFDEQKKLFLADMERLTK